MGKIRKELETMERRTSKKKKKKLSKKNQKLGNA